MPGSQRTRTTEGRKPAQAGLIAVTLVTLFVMAWAIFPSAAGAAPPPVFVPGNPQCSNFGLLETFGGTVTITGDENEGTQQVAWSSAIPIDAVIVKGGPGSNVYFYSEATSDSGLTAPVNPNTGNPFGVSHVSLCYDQDITTTPPTTTTEPPTTTTEPPTTTTKPPTTTTEPPTTTTEPPTTTTEPPTTTTEPPTTTTEPPTTTTTPPQTTTTQPPPTTTTESPTVGPTTVEPTESDTVSPTTVTPGGTAFTGVENVVPLGALAIFMMTAGSGLLWAGSRRRKGDE